MAIIKCKMCGGDIELSPDKTFGTCEYCGSTMTFPKIDDEHRAEAFNRGNHFRRIGEFDKALTVYERIVQEDSTDAEAHWCCALCRFGIEYVKDPDSGEYLPTCHRASFDSFLEDVDCRAALEHADAATREQYRRDAEQIAEVQRRIMSTVQKEAPFDVFICYKETGSDGRRTVDSTLAQDIYYQLTEQGRRVFFARITLEDKAGQEYEPYIFAALHSAKVMLVVGTKPEHFNAVWVKNEWSRYLSLMKNDRKRLLIPCYRDMDPYDLPEQLAVLQSYDMGRIGFIQDLIRGVSKVLGAEKSEAGGGKGETVVVQSEGAGNLTALLKRGNMALEDGEWDKADGFFEQVLNMDAECAEAYWGKAMVTRKIHSTIDFIESYSPEYLEDKNIQRAKKFAGPEVIDLFTRAENELAKRKKDRIKRAPELAEIRKKISPCTKMIDSSFHTVGLKADGTVVAVGSNRYKECNMSHWTDIISISASPFVTIGLKADGTVVAVGDNENWRCNISGWTDIISVAAGDCCTIGLKKDGTVVATGDDDDDDNYGEYGECDIDSWNGIVSVAAGSKHTVGIKSDGTVVATGDNKCGQCNVSGWADIVAVAAGYLHTVGLKSDGTLVAVGDNEDGQCNVSTWNDIVAVAVGSWCHTIGLKADGTVVAVGDNTNGQCNVSTWSDIVAVAAGDNCTVGLKADGTVVAVGDNTNGQCDVSKWKLFNSFDTLSQEIEEAKAAQQRRKEAEIEADRKRQEDERRRKEQKAEIKRQRRITSLKEERDTLQTELAKLKGLFTGKRRKEIEGRLAQIDKELAELE